MEEQNNAPAPGKHTDNGFPGLRLGCLVAPLAEQLERFRFDPSAMDHFQRDMEAISRAHIRHLIPYSAAMKAYDKLAKKITAHVEDCHRATGAAS